MPGLTSAEKKLKLAKMSYQDFLLNVAKVDKQALWFFMHFGEGNSAWAPMRHQRCLDGKWVSRVFRG